MEFEQMQIVWNQQNNEKLYAINEAALFDKIKRKSKNAKFQLNLMELILIAASLFVVVEPFLFDKKFGLNWSNYILIGMYLALGIYTAWQRYRRKREESAFTPTMLGELDKAIWRVNRLLGYGKQVMLFLLPVTITVSTIFFMRGQIALGIGFIIFVIFAAVVGMQWEVKKIHIPNKKSLEALREMLTADTQ